MLHIKEHVTAFTDSWKTDSHKMRQMHCAHIQLWPIKLLLKTKKMCYGTNAMNTTENYNGNGIQRVTAVSMLSKSVNK